MHKFKKRESDREKKGISGNTFRSCIQACPEILNE